jgi:hypothetical protein
MNAAIRQYRDTQAIADFQAARIRYSQPEPCQFCAVEDEVPVDLISEDFAIAVIGVAALVFLAIYFAWGIA